MPRSRIAAGETRFETVILASRDSLVIERNGRLSILGPDAAVRIDAGDAVVRNEGVIDSEGTSIFGSGALTVENLSGGSILGEGSAAVAIDSGTLTLSNRGAITSYASAAITSGGRLDLRNLDHGTIVGKQGVHAAGGSIVNDARAQISGRTDGIVIDDGAGGAVPNTTRIVNHGTIEGQSGAAIRIVGDGDDRIVNHGLINSTDTNVGIDAGGGDDRVINSGVIFQPVRLGDGNDMFRNTGTVYGMIDGGAGADRIDAGPGNTRIVGGLGRDILTGGAGSDRFEYHALAESAATLDAADRITDFDNASGDVIDLTAIDADSTTVGAQAFNNIGTLAFTGHGGELRVIAVAAGVAVLADVDGDAVADFALLLVGITDPAATQFSL